MYRHVGVCMHRCVSVWGVGGGGLKMINAHA